jgi:hypothetical protein
MYELVAVSQTVIVNREPRTRDFVRERSTCVTRAFDATVDTAVGVPVVSAATVAVGLATLPRGIPAAGAVAAVASRTVSATVAGVARRMP